MRLEEVLEKYRIDEVAFAGCFRCDEPDVDSLALEEDGRKAGAFEEIRAAWEALQRAFEVATRVGESHLTLQVDFHNRENDGHRHDEVDGVFYAVDSAY
jgi:hypothetical protein